MKTVYIRVKAEDATHYAQEYDLPVDKEIPIKEVPITDLLPSDTFEAFRAGFMAHQPLSRQWGDFEEERCKKEHEKWLQ